MKRTTLIIITVASAWLASGIIIAVASAWLASGGRASGGRASSDDYRLPGGDANAFVAGDWERVDDEPDGEPDYLKEMTKEAFEPCMRSSVLANGDVLNRMSMEDAIRLYTPVMMRKMAPHNQNLIEFLKGQDREVRNEMYKMIRDNCVADSWVNLDEK